MLRSVFDISGPTLGDVEPMFLIAGNHHPGPSAMLVMHGATGTCHC
jgi:hypothetical protein